MLANILLGIGIFTGILGLLDGAILSDRQKKVISDRTVQLWNWLDDVRRSTLLRFFNRKLVRFIGITGGAMYVLWRSAAAIIGEPTMTFHFEIEGVDDVTVPRNVDINDFIAHWPDFIFVFFVLIFAVWLSSIFLVRIIRRSPEVGFIKSSAIATSIYLSGSLILDALSRVAEKYNQDGLVHMAAVIAYVFFSAIGLVVVFPVMLFCLAFILFVVIEFLVRRIAEQPKGPLAAFSAIATGVGAILKAFT